MPRFYYASSIHNFLTENPNAIVGRLVQHHEFASEEMQVNAWVEEITILKRVLPNFNGKIYLEYSIPRMGKRIDAVCIIGPIIFVLEFKVGEMHYLSSALDQVMDYALDLKNFHQTSHDQIIAPILISTDAKESFLTISTTPQNDKLLYPIKCNASSLREVINNVQFFAKGEDEIVADQWENGSYHPTPTIVEAATALYRGHSVADISRSDASAKNLNQTTNCITEIVRQSKIKSEKSICFVTGVPGAGKTLVGLNIATLNMDRKHELYSVFLSGNGPLVAILREALTRDRVNQEKENGVKIKKGEVMSEVKMFIQNVHHFRDECLIDVKPPIEHVALFDEAQRAWDLEQTAKFMRLKKKKAGFNQSESEFLISCLDRHPDWAVIVCLVGGGQEINTGEAGIQEWLSALDKSFHNWQIYVSRHLTDSEYAAQDALKKISKHSHVHYKDELHLAVSMRSFRAENVSLLVKQILDLDVEGARRTLTSLQGKYPIVITRSLPEAKKWLKKQARGSERYGIVVSSQAERLKPHAIDVKSPMDPIHWFLDGKEDVRSSFYLEDVATEFDIQGLELDWSCVTWDADFRYSLKGWEHRSFVGDRWNQIKKAERQVYLKNAYRVLLTRARQGMVIVVPEGDSEDHTRKAEYYDPTFEYLKSIGMRILQAL